MGESFVERFEAEAGDVLTSIFTHSCDCIKLLTLDGRLEYVSDSAMDALGLASPDEAVGRSWPAFWPESERERILEAVARAAAGESVRVAAATGDAAETRHWEVAISPVRGAGGALTHLLAVSTEVTAHVESARLERDRAELAEREVNRAATLTRELRHRLKNQLAVVGAVAKLLSRHTADARDMARKLEAKLIALAQAQDLLAISHDQPLGVREAVAEVIRASGAGERVEVAGMPERDLPDESVQQLALLLNELQTNALKHGALRDEGGRVRLSASADDEILTMCWEEDCAAPVQPVDSGAGGFQLIQRLGSAGGKQPIIAWNPTGIAVEFHVRIMRQAALNPVR